MIKSRFFSATVLLFVMNTGIIFASGTDCSTVPYSTLKRSAQHKEAQFEMGRRHNDNGNHALALHFYELSSKQGHKKAKENLLALKQKHSVVTSQSTQNKILEEAHSTITKVLSASTQLEKQVKTKCGC